MGAQQGKADTTSSSSTTETTESTGTTGDSDTKPKQTHSEEPRRRPAMKEHKNTLRPSHIVGMGAQQGKADTSSSASTTDTTGSTTSGGDPKQTTNKSEGSAEPERRVAKM
ncbi:hypothetical protein Pelo_3663 [Pelomyxa schiedti]|nr:hypothetical protein Pelo_3663 [Pelomyxa schiedti]